MLKLVDLQSDEDGLVRKAVNLFTFLGRTQQLLVKPVHTVEGFEEVVWFSKLPTHPAVRSRHGSANLEAEEPLVEVDRVPRLDPPDLPARLVEWVSGPFDDIDQHPFVREAIFTDEPEKWTAPQDVNDESPDDERDRRRVLLSEAVGVSEAFEEWLPTWQAWADREREDAVARDLYKDLFAIYLKSTDHSEEFELVVGVGCLAWRPEGHAQVQRHVATAQVAVAFDESSGTLTVRQVPSPQSVVVELDMLDPSLVSSPAAIDEIRVAAGEYSAHVLDAAAVGDICRRLIIRLDPDASYDDVLKAPTGADPRGAFAPAFILRRRTNRGLVQIYEQIVAQILASNEVPSGVLPLIDPDQQPEAQPNDTPGAVVTIDEEDFLPLPVNEAQRRVIDRVDATAQTVVQGPPGTGKTHTAAALVSHLLAQGKRVLITAHTDRALREVRAKLPREIRSLAVSVIGQSRSDMADLRTAVENISRRADEFEPAESARAIEQHHAKLDQLRRQRAETQARLVEVRKMEIETRTDGPVEGTLASIAYRNLQDEPQYEWIREFDVDPRGGDSTVSDDEIKRWRAILLDRDVIDHEAEAVDQLPSQAVVPTSDAFTAMVLREQQAVSTREQFGVLLSHESFEFVRSLDPALRHELRERVSALAERAVSLEQRHETWMNDALSDVRSGRQQTWISRSQQVKALGDSASLILDRLGPTTTVVVPGDFSVQQQVAKTLLAYLQSGGKIKVQADGAPKVGAFTSKTVKQSDGFFRDVKVNGVPATTTDQLAAVIDWVEASRTVTAMDQAWPVSVVIPHEDTFGERVQWHRTEVEQLDKVLALGEQVEVERAWFTRNSLPVPNWNDLEEIRRYATLVEAAAATDEAAAASHPIEQLVDEVCERRPRPNLVPITAELVRAMSERDLSGFNAARVRLEHLHRVANTVANRERIHAALMASAPRLADAIVADPGAFEWDERLGSYEKAWRWELTSRWILAQDDEDVNVLKAKLSDIDRQIRNEVEHLAAERAWAHAVAPGRLTGSARANLTQYAQLVASLGKGTGKYAAKKRAEITEAMDRCRPSVPVWIMPIYRIAEQVRVQPNLYDVVIVDEASQAGLEASFLQYLAPKIVVIGDDKQVSPSAVGVDQQQLRDLANQYLATDPYRASWLDPKRSYFDEATMRFGGRITLVEHRRCVPEIIGFSNRIAYEPEGIRLVPVRQFGAERLEPIRVVHLEDGYETDNKTNPVEAEAIVDQIRKCLAEPQYDGKTIGVISLLGKEQARLIEHRLLDAVPPEEWTARELRCGDAPDFQGSERDITFLSMVKAPSETRRLSALTATQYVQRFNVAASRAKDQMWVYHSMAREDLGNTEDMRYQLLDYCYGVANQARNDGPSLGVVPDDVLVAPFDSLFEQRVYNRIIDRGYTVHAQYPALGYNIDLVIIGAKGKLAVECDGDFWHGPDVYEADLARQRELERCGWEFFRIRESIFYADMASSLKKLWDTLDELDIRTADWIDPSFDEDVPDEIAGAIDELLVDEAIADVADAGDALRELNSVIDANSTEIVDHAPDVDLDIETSSGGRHRSAKSSNVEHELLDDLDAVDEIDRQHTIVEVPTRAAERVPEADLRVVPNLETTVGSVLRPYVSFGEPLPPVNQSSLEEMEANVVKIVSAEGPVLGHRIHNAYRDAYGGHRVGKEIARLLNRAISIAERHGHITSDNPLNESGLKPRTFRLPSQPDVSPRELGPRSLDLVPPAELCHHLSDLSLGDDLQSEDELFRAVLDRLGLIRLTENARSVLTAATALIADAEPDTPTVAE
ncbi:AAA domain-containing protein [Aldersonia sp. NBC_00410]|uniref:AAA domain-containing protein n=1 Tax=Aldersonia sp. NBC_00410 TaxID=2975954 RepID=UPI002250AF0C|nr:AAA domain-containing protein [Aldersonia sp. NBC_00410]MCX5042425.1 AAA domain-containing protein [Aldersonia sp. NBC_00410]